MAKGQGEICWSSLEPNGVEKGQVVKISKTWANTLLRIDVVGE